VGDEANGVSRGSAGGGVGRQPRSAAGGSSNKSAEEKLYCCKNHEHCRSYAYHRLYFTEEYVTLLFSSELLCLLGRNKVNVLFRRYDFRGIATVGSHSDAIRCSVLPRNGAYCAAVQLWLGFGTYN